MVLDTVRFGLYTFAMSAFTVVSFATQKVPPLSQPEPGTIGFRPFAESFPGMPITGLVDPVDFPGEDRRLRRIRSSVRLLALARRLAPSHSPPIPADHESFLRAVYPWLLSRAWPTRPSVPPALRPTSDEPVDVIAQLAVDGPFGSYLAEALDDTGLATGEYRIDLDWLIGYPVRAGLLPPGGVAYLALREGRLRTVGLTREGAPVPLSEWRGRQPEVDAMLAGMNEDLTTIRHNLFVHLATLTPFALASSNALSPDHPVRRLLHHCFQTVLIGNRELATIQLGGPDAFAASIFSHDHVNVARMAVDRLASYDFWDLEPEQQFARRGTTITPFDYPYRDNILELWRVNLDYVRTYLALYYDDDIWQRDAQLQNWLGQLDELLPHGLGKRGESLDWLARLCATVIHVSTVEHDVLNNVTWDYSTLGWIIPTVAPLNGDRMDRRRAFDIIATLIVTWKPYTMLLTANVPSLALDEGARIVMTNWIAALEQVQVAMTDRGVQPSLTYPANFNVSISN